MDTIPTGQLVTVRVAETSGELPVPGKIAAAPVAPAQGPTGQDAGSPVVVVVQEFFQNKTIRLGLTLVAAGFAFFIGYVCDEILQTKTFFGNLPWPVDVLIVVAVGSSICALVYFWDSPIVAKFRKAIIAGVSAFLAYVLTVIIGNAGLDGVDWHKTIHAATNAAAVVAAGGLIIFFKVKDNNPVNPPGKSDGK